MAHRQMMQRRYRMDFWINDFLLLSIIVFSCDYFSVIPNVSIKHFYSYSSFRLSIFCHSFKFSCRHHIFVPSFHSTYQNIHVLLSVRSFRLAACFSCLAWNKNHNNIKMCIIVLNNIIVIFVCMILYYTTRIMRVVPLKWFRYL